LLTTDNDAKDIVISHEVGVEVEITDPDGDIGVEDLFLL
jgi:hypothetical protein